MLDKYIESVMKFLCIVLFCEVKLSKMVSIEKKNKIKKTGSAFLIQFLMIYNFAHGPIETPHL